MNIKQQNAIRGLLKKHGYKNAGNVVRPVLGINFDVFLQKTEPLYVIPRIASCYNNENDKKKLMDVVYKEWLKDVVDNRWCDAVNVYTDEHGERIVLQAIYYLMNNNLWDVYEGKLALDAREDNYYDKLDDMPSAIEIIKESIEEQVQEEPKIQNEPAPSTPSPFMDADEAMELMDATKELCARFTQNFEKLSDFIYTAADTDALRAKMSEQQKRIEGLTKKLEDSNATMQKASDYISKLRQEAEESQREYSELNEKYKKALDERDAADRELNACKKLLDEEAQKEQLPKKKTIPFSSLDAVPLLGRAVMTGLVPVLAKYNIVVDYNK